MSSVEPDLSRRGSKAEFAYETIRSWIVEGVYQPGDRLVLEQIARRLGISPVPVREALRRLEAEGYANFQRNAGARVSTIEMPAYGDSMEVLGILEGAATALSAKHLTEADLTRARQINEDMSASVDSLDPVGFTAANKTFHEVLYSRCPNRHLVTEINREWSRLAVIRRSTFAFVPQRALDAIVEHRQMLDLIAADVSPGEIERRVRSHTLATAHAFLRRAQREAGEEEPVR